MHLLRRLWETAKNRRRFRPEGQQHAGRLAEQAASRELAEAFADRPRMSIWSGSRLPDPGTGRLREIDFVVACGTSVAAIELKNWVGRIEVRNGQVIQHGSRGRETNHGRLFARLGARLESLQAYLKERDVRVETLRSYLVFANPDIRLDEDFAHPDHEIVIGGSPDAATSVGSSASSDPTAIGETVRRLVDDIFESELDSSPGSAEQHDQLREALDAVGTWDRLHLYGGRIVTGDIEWCFDPDHPCSNRADIASIEFDITRSYIDSIRRTPAATLSAVRRDGATETYQTNLDEAVCIRAAGDDHFTEIDVRHLDRLVYGAEQNLKRTLTWAELEHGESYKGRITGITDFGVFVDIGAPTDGLVHISNVDRHRHTKPHELPKRFTEGELVEVRLSKIDRDANELSFATLAPGRD